MPQDVSKLVGLFFLNKIYMNRQCVKCAKKLLGIFVHLKKTVIAIVNTSKSALHSLFMLFRTVSTLFLHTLPVC